MHNVILSLLQDLYPNNKLRNLAWDLVRTPYILLSDLDFIPDDNVYSRLRAYLKHGILNDTQGVCRAKGSFTFEFIKRELLHELLDK